MDVAIPYKKKNQNKYVGSIKRFVFVVYSHLSWKFSFRNAYSLTIKVYRFMDSGFLFHHKTPPGPDLEIVQSDGGTDFSARAAKK